MPRRPKGTPKPIAKTAARMSRRASLNAKQLAACEDAQCIEVSISMEKPAM